MGWFFLVFFLFFKVFLLLAVVLACHACMCFFRAILYHSNTFLESGEKKQSMYWNCIS